MTFRVWLGVTKCFRFTRMGSARGTRETSEKTRKTGSENNHARATAPQPRTKWNLKLPRILLKSDKKMSDPCSFSKPSECACTHISWFVNVLFDKQILDCRAELDFEVKEHGDKNLVRGFDFTFDFLLELLTYLSHLKLCQIQTSVCSMGL